MEQQRNLQLQKEIGYLQDCMRAMSVEKDQQQRWIGKFVEAYPDYQYWFDLDEQKVEPEQGNLANKIGPSGSQQISRPSKTPTTFHQVDKDASWS